MANLLLHSPQRKEQKHLTESAKREVESIILAANHVKVGVAQHPETGTSLGNQKRLLGFLQCPLDGQGETDLKESEWSGRRFIVVLPF